MAKQRIVSDLILGEIKLQFGKVSGLWKLVKGGNAELMQSSSEVKLSFPLLLRGVACAYDFGYAFLFK